MTDWAENALGSLSYAHKEVLLYRLLVEEILLEWQTALGSDTAVTVALKETKRAAFLTLEAPGESFNPLSATEEKPDYLPPRLIQRLDNDVSWKYRRKTNVITCTLSHCENYHLTRSLLVVGLPFALQFLLNSIVTASDSLMLGVLDQSALAAVSLIGKIMYIYTFLTGAAVVGTTVLTSQYWGRKDRFAAEKLLGISVRLALALSLVFWAGFFLFPGSVMRILTNDPSLIACACQYMRITAWAFPLIAFSSIILGIMKSTEKSILSAIFSTVTMAVNVVLNYILIYGKLGFPAMGIRGAATATLLAQFLIFLHTFLFSLRKDSVRLRLYHLLHTDRDMRKRYLNEALPSVMQTSVWMCGQFAISAIIGHIGNDAAAAFGVMGIINNVACSFIDGIASACGVIIGFELGRSHMARARRFSRRMLRLVFAAGLVLGLLIFLLRFRIAALQPSLSPTALRNLYFMLIVCACVFPFRSLSTTFTNGIFKPGGCSRAVTVIDAVNLWAVIVPLGYLSAFVFPWPILVTFLILGIDEASKIPAVLLYYRKDKWLKNLIS